MSVSALLVVALLGQIGTAPPPPVPQFPPSGSQQTTNLVQWDANALPQVHERSEQPPLTDAEIVKMGQSGFAPDQLAKLVEERRCACDASAEGLIRLRAAGVDPAVISAVSTHALRPNRTLNLEV